MIDPKDAGYIEHLETEIKKLRAQIQERDAEIKGLRKEKGLSSAREGLTFQPRTGLYLEASSGIHYCPKCLAKEKRHPLTDEEWGWRCHVCDAFYSNPDKAPPDPVLA
jgi:hypothetical protein